MGVKGSSTLWRNGWIELSLEGVGLGTLLGVIRGCSFGSFGGVTRALVLDSFEGNSKMVETGGQYTIFRASVGKCLSISNRDNCNTYLSVAHGLHPIFLRLSRARVFGSWVVCEHV